MWPSMSITRMRFSLKWLVKCPHSSSPRGKRFLGSLLVRSWDEGEHDLCAAEHKRSLSSIWPYCKRELVGYFSSGFASRDGFKLDSKARAGGSLDQLAQGAA